MGRKTFTLSHNPRERTKKDHSLLHSLFNKSFVFAQSLRDYVIHKLRKLCPEKIARFS